MNRKNQIPRGGSPNRNETTMTDFILIAASAMLAAQSVASLLFG